MRSSRSLRTVDSNSWLATEVRGRGLATAMRTGVLALAFDHLGVVAAVSSAEVGNAPSLAVSRRLGYAHNGLSLTRSPHGVIELQHLRLPRRDLARGSARRRRGRRRGCLPWFGLGPTLS